MSATVQDALGNMVGQSENVRLVVNTSGRFSCRSLTIWKSRSAAFAS